MDSARAALGMCALLLLPAVYGCVRYLPTILHHPIWFEGDYNAETSVHSFDPWDSEKYISFDEMVYSDVGRILNLFGIHLRWEGDKLKVKTALMLYAEAAEPGDSPENPFTTEPVYKEQPATNALNIRKTIYLYTLKHLNLIGHETGQLSFWVNETKQFIGHSHNMYLQIAYNYGIVVGIIFMVWSIGCLIHFLRKQTVAGLCQAVFLVSILVWGSTEETIGTGTITMVLLFLLYYFGMQKESRTKSC